MGFHRTVRRCRAALLLVFLALTSLFVWRCPRQRPYSPFYGLVDPVDTSSRFAIATFLGSDTARKDEDKYFVACRLLTYQLLYSNETRIRDELRDRIDWVVTVTADVAPWKRKQLEADGAKVVELEHVPLRWWIKTGVSRWKDQFTKLRILLWTEYSRVLFLDADTLLQGPLDGIFFTRDSILPAKTDFRYRKGDEADLPAEYVFLAAPDHQFTGKRKHAVPPDGKETTGSLSAGFWLAAPSRELYAYLMSVMAHYYRFDPKTMEQSLLNYAFRRCDTTAEEKEASGECPPGRRPGPMPWRELDWRWSTTWPSMDDARAGVVSLHEKLWKAGPKGLRKRWRDRRGEMEDKLGLPSA
ncbi:hypothetical protein VUR80DRAFT_9102 [Thermomyces stellatus]